MGEVGDVTGDPGQAREIRDLKLRVFQLETALKTIANYTRERPLTFVHQIAIGAVPPDLTNGGDPSG